MGLYKGTGCSITVIAYLKKISSDQTHVLLERNCLKNSEEKTEYYVVYADKSDISRIIQFGYPGMLLSVTGDLYFSIEDAGVFLEVFAEKIEFLHFPGAQKFDSLADVNEEKVSFAEKKFEIPFLQHTALYACASRNVQ